MLEGVTLYAADGTVLIGTHGGLPVEGVAGGTAVTVAGTITSTPSGTQTVANRFFANTAAAYTRPANTTAYSVNDQVANNATPASVTAVTFTVSNVNDAPIALIRLRLLSTDTGPGTAAASFRAWFFNSDPTAASGVGGGDNIAWSQKQAGFIGSMIGTFRSFSDGSGAVLTPDEGSYIITTPVSGAETIYMLLQTLTVFTPSANSTTFTGTLEGLQGVA